MSKTIFETKNINNASCKGKVVWNIGVWKKLSTDSIKNEQSNPTTWRVEFCKIKHPNLVTSTSRNIKFLWYFISILFLENLMPVEKRFYRYLSA